jgi:hypothetical protein
MSNIQRTSALGVDSNLTAGELLQVKEDLSLPADTAGAIAAMTAAANATAALIAKLRAKVDARRGLSADRIKLDQAALCGEDTTAISGESGALISPPGNTAPTTFAALVSAVAAASPGHVIRIPANTTLTFTAQLVLPVGVSIVGGGRVKFVQGFTPVGTTQADAAMILAASASENTNGNQVIKHIDFLGNNYAGSNAVYVKARSNVKVIDCTGHEFNFNFVTFNGRNSEVDGEASVKATGNGVYNCESTGCCVWVGPKDTTGYASGIVQFGSQNGFEILNSILIAKGRGSTNNGYPVKFYKQGYSDNTKIVNNTIRKDANDGTPGFFIFTCELWGERNLLISGNYFEGRLDINGAKKTSSSVYGLQVLSNVFGTNTLPTNVANGGAIGLELHLDGTAPSDVVIAHNYFRNCWHAVYFYQRSGMGTNKWARYWIYNNACLNSRLIDWVIATPEGGSEDWWIWRNTMRRESTASAMNSGVQLPRVGTNARIYVLDNIIAGFSGGAISCAKAATVGGVANGLTIDTLVTVGNYLFGNAANSVDLAVDQTVTPTNFTESNRIADPIFDADDTLTKVRNAFQGVVGANLYAGLGGAPEHAGVTLAG